MPTTAVGLYELLLEQDFGGEKVLNVFHYLSNTSDDDEQDLCATAFDEDIMAALAAIQSSLVTYEFIRVKNITGTLADSVLTPSQTDGDVVGANMTGALAVSFRYNRVSKDTRNGSKRFVGLIEENVTASTFIPAYITDLDALAVLLGTDISTVGGVFAPVIVRKPPDGAGVYTYNTVANVVALNRVTTQNSRKNF